MSKHTTNCNVEMTSILAEMLAALRLVSRELLDNQDNVDDIAEVVDAAIAKAEGIINA